MPARSPRSSRSKPRHIDVLTSLASGVDDAFCNLTPDEPAHLIRVIADPRKEELELGLLPLERGDHPAAVMAGFKAPPTWTAVGVVTGGRSHELIGADASGRRSQRIRLTFLLDRSGAAITLLTPFGVSPGRRRMLTEPPVGLLADACRRVLGLPTDPPAEGPQTWLTARWLDRVLAAIVDAPGAIAMWESAVALHPLVSAGAAPRPEALVDLVEEAASSFGWEHLRLVAAQQQGPDPAVEPAVAAWMDAGSFARHVLAAELPLDLLLTVLWALLPQAVFAAVRDAVPQVWIDRSC
jgi:hypothetical protein